MPIDAHAEAAPRRLWDRLHDDEAHVLLITLRGEITGLTEQLHAAWDLTNEMHDQNAALRIENAALAGGRRRER